MSIEQHMNCNGCHALNAMKWDCDLGYPVAAIKTFKPTAPCPKPTTTEELTDAPRYETPIRD